MARMTAEMVIDLKDKTGAATRAVIGNLDRLKKAERDYALSAAGVRLSEKDRRMEQLLIARDAEIKARRARWAALGRDVAVGTVAAGYAGAKAYENFAQLERRVGRIVINADEGASKIAPTIDNLRKVANATKMPFDSMVTGLETLVASGRSLQESMDFIPSVALTAQASGAAVEDIALSADSLAGSMKIGAGEMQKAFDILVAGGKAGKFELKDMSQYLPSLLPAYAALGYKGTEGLQKIVAMLQIVRNQTGDSASAATNLQNVFQKMESQETVNKFKKFGVDLNKEMKKARDSGKDLIDAFLDVTEKASKGDLSKIPLLFNDAEVQKGVRALITQRQELAKLNAALKNVDGSTLRDFGQIASDSAAKIQQMSNNWDGFVSRLGQTIAPGANTVLEGLNQATDYMDAIRQGLEKRGMGMAQREAWLFYNLPLGGFSNSEEADKLAFDNGYRGEDMINRMKERQNRNMRGRGLGYVQDYGGEADLHNWDPARQPRRPGQKWRSPVPVPQPRPSMQDDSAAAGYDLYARTRRQNDLERRNVGFIGAGQDGVMGRSSAVDPGEKLKSAADEASSKLAEGGAQAGSAAAGAFSGQASAIGDAIGAAAARRFMSSINIPVAPQSLGSRPPMPAGTFNNSDMSGVHATTNDSGL